MFRSRRRPIVISQADHARFAATIALAWGNAAFPRPEVPWDRFVEGVAVHDRGYGELDSDPIGGGMAPGRWLEIQQGSFRPRGRDPIVDLIAAMHVRRLVGDDPAGDEMERAFPALRDGAGVTVETAVAADRITNVCDMVSFDFCFEVPVEDEAAGIRYWILGDGRVTLDPWPLAVPRLVGLVTAYAADSYPSRLEPVVAPFDICPLATL